MKITLPIPPSANRYWRIYNGHAVTSENAREDKVEAGWKYRASGGIMYYGPVDVALFVYRARRAGDLDNFIKVLLDALRGLAYEDDKQVVAIHAYLRDDKANPRVEVHIMEAA